MNKKRAEGLSINMIIIAALGLIVLVIVAVILKTQLSHYSVGYKDTADKAIKSAEGYRCVPLFLGTTRRCTEIQPTATNGEWKPIPPEKDKWVDCGVQCWEWEGGEPIPAESKK